MNLSEKSKFKVFLDLDGVLADFASGCESIFGMPIKDSLERTCYDVSFNSILKPKLEAFPDFFFNLEPLPGAATLFNLLSQFDLTILTAMPTDWKAHEERSLAVGSAKRRWVEKHFGKTKFYCVESGTKHLYIDNSPQTTCLLIDDFMSNVSKWVAHGGTAIYHTQLASTLDAFELVRPRVLPSSLYLPITPSR